MNSSVVLVNVPFNLTNFLLYQNTGAQINQRHVNVGTRLNYYLWLYNEMCVRCKNENQELTKE